MIITVFVSNFLEIGPPIKEKIGYIQICIHTIMIAKDNYYLY